MMYLPRKHCGFWLKRSFFSIQGKNFTKGVFLGIHKLRNIRNVDEPIEEDYRPKTSIVFLNNYMQFEAVLFPSSEVAKLISAIHTLSPNQNVLIEGKKKAELIFNNPDLTSIYEHYIVKNLHTVNLQKVHEASYQIGLAPDEIRELFTHIEQNQPINQPRTGNFFVKAQMIDPDTRPQDIQWLRESCIFIKRRIKNKSFIQQMVIVGKDTRYDIPVIGMRKTWENNNFYTIFPLVDDLPLEFVTNFFFIALHKPPEAPFEPIKAFIEKIEQWAFYFSTHTTYTNIDIINPPLSDVLNVIKKVD